MKLNKNKKNADPEIFRSWQKVVFLFLITLDIHICPQYRYIWYYLDSTWWDLSIETKNWNHTTKTKYGCGKFPYSWILATPYPYTARMVNTKWVRAIFLAYRIGESVDLPVHGKPYLSPHHSELPGCLPTQYTGEEFLLSPQCMDDFRFSDVT